MVSSLRPVLCAHAGHSPPPVSDTKRAFLEAYPRPLPGIYDTVIQELLVQQHLLRFQKKYSYDPVRRGCLPAQHT